ncbi:MAG: tripartite tricarboxylate transporter TctB family protein [Tabrizicola sp.]
MSAEPEPRANRLESLALTILFAVLSSGLLALIGVATRSNAKGGWWTQPWLMPGIALGLLVLANLITLWEEAADLRANPLTAAEKAEGRALLLGWLRPLEYLGYYAIYIYAIQHLGYFPSTLVFVLFLLWRVGLTAPRWQLAGLALVVFMIGVFRMGLGVWMPAPEFYELFPGAIRTALIRWF